MAWLDLKSYYRIVRRVLTEITRNRNESFCSLLSDECPIMFSAFATLDLYLKNKKYVTTDKVHVLFYGYSTIDLISFFIMLMAFSCVTVTYFFLSRYNECI
jgi:hypothetical protein